MKPQRHLEAEAWVEAVAALAVIVAIPFYMGFVHLGIIELLAYAAVGAFSMSVGQALRDRTIARLRIDEFFYDMGLWLIATSTIGGACYLIALVLV